MRRVSCLWFGRPALALFSKVGSGLFYLVLFFWEKCATQGMFFSWQCQECQSPCPSTQACFKPLPVAHAMVLLARASHMAKPKVSGAGNILCLSGE